VSETSDPLAPAPGTSPLLEVDATSLDELWHRIDKKLVAGLPQEISDHDYLAVATRLRAQRDRYIQQQTEAALKPKRTRGTPAPKSVAEITVTW
jgi:hypothetical protein